MLTYQQMSDNILNCHDGNDFDHSLIAALHNDYNVYSYAETSITYSYKDRLYHASYEWQSNAWIIKEIQS
jgi:hypothetical protein